LAFAQYQHFTIEQLADGVYAAVATPDGSAACNAGIVVIDGRTLVFDTFATLPAARELRAAAEALTGLPIAYVINSHDHVDHVHGNVVFADQATLISSRETRTTMENLGLQRMEGFRNHIRQAVRGVEEQLARTTDAQERTRLLKDVADGGAFLAGLPGPADFRLPCQTFTSQLTFHGPGRTARLLACGGGHSGGDAVLHLPEEGILFTGDLVTSGDLVLRYGDPERWLEALDRLEALNPKVIIPGHGRILAGDEGLSRARQYLAELSAIAQRAVGGGATEASVDEMPVPEGLEAYWYRDNLRFLIRRLLAKGQG
jgi:cyclase